jgi:hypothetical protein
LACVCWRTFSFGQLGGKKLKVWSPEVVVPSALVAMSR